MKKKRGNRPKTIEKNGIKFGWSDFYGFYVAMPLPDSFWELTIEVGSNEWKKLQSV